MPRGFVSLMTPFEVMVQSSVLIVTDTFTESPVPSFIEMREPPSLPRIEAPSTFQE
jgi:hypothetical protein